MYFERDVGGHTALVYIDHVYGHGDIYIVAIDNGVKVTKEDGYVHGRDADAVEAFKRRVA